MKKTSSVLLGVLALLLAGCATTFRPWNLSKIQRGMTKSAVIQVLGDPAYIETSGNTEYLYYSYSEGYNPALTIGDPLDSEGFQEIREAQRARSLRVYRYVVELRGGMVLRYQEVID